MIKRKLNENDLINTYTKKQLEELLKYQIDFENYEGAQVVKSAIDQYDTATVTGKFDEEICFEN